MIVTAIASVICLTFGTAQTGEVQIIPDVKISLTSLPVTDADAISKVTWRAIAPSVIYCVSEHPTVNLYFDCPDCDPKVPHEKKFMDQLVNAKRLPNAQYPVIAIGQSFSIIDVNGRINGKHLRCNANYTSNTRTNQESNNDLQVKSVSAELDIKYVDTPVLVDKSGTEFADIIYVHASGQDLISVKCTANGNPVPQAGHLMIGGKKVDSLHSSVGKPDQGSTIQCTVEDEFKLPYYSRTYQVKLYDIPVVIDTKYESGGHSLGQQRTLECTVKATPQPTVTWKMITGDNRRVTAACDQYGNATGHTNISTQNQITYFHVTSTCRITMDSYLKEGKYYCEGCLELVKDSPICSPQTLSNETANILIRGKPVFNDWISVARLNETTIVEIVTQVCANPNPQIYWIISGRKIIENKTVDNFYAHSRVEVCS